MEQEIRYSALLQHLQAGIVVHAPDTTIIMNNARAAELLRLTNEQLRGKTAIDPAWRFISEDNCTLSVAEYPVSRIISNRQPIENQILGVECSDCGNITWLTVNGVPLFNSNGDLVEVVISFIDITERKIAEEKLKESETRFRNVTNSSMALIWLSGVDKLCYYFNDTWLKFTGRTLEQEMGNGWAEGVHPDEFDQCLETYITSFDKQVAFEMEYRLKHHSGEYRWLVDLGTPNYDSARKFIGYIGHCFDITDRKKMELELQRSEKNLQRAQEITHIGSWHLDIASNDVLWTEELYRMYGFDPTVPPPPYTEHQKLFTPESWELLSTSLARTAETGIPYQLELKTVRKDKSNGWMWVRGEAEFDKKGNITGLWGAAQDISERRNMEDKLRESEKSLIKKTQELEYFNNFFVNRELRMVELKKEVNELLEKHGLEKRYD